MIQLDLKKCFSWAVVVDAFSPTTPVVLSQKSPHTGAGEMVQQLRTQVKPEGDGAWLQS